MEAKKRSEHDKLSDRSYTEYLMCTRLGDQVLASLLLPSTAAASGCDGARSHRQRKQCFSNAPNACPASLQVQNFSWYASCRSLNPRPKPAHQLVAPACVLKLPVQMQSLPNLSRPAGFHPRGDNVGPSIQSTATKNKHSPSFYPYPFNQDNQTTLRVSKKTNQMRYTKTKERRLSFSPMA